MVKWLKRRIRAKRNECSNLEAGDVYVYAASVGVNGKILLALSLQIFFRSFFLHQVRPLRRTGILSRRGALISMQTGKLDLKYQT